MLHLDSAQDLQFLAIQDHDLISHQAQGETLSGGPLDPEKMLELEGWPKLGGYVWQKLQQNTGVHGSTGPQ